MFASGKQNAPSGSGGESSPRRSGDVLEISFAEMSDSGRIRATNEDSLGHFAPATLEQGRTLGWLFALADGVGGSAQGEVASRTAIDAMLAGFRQMAPGEALSSSLRRLVQMANAHVLEKSATAGLEARGMATTLVACALRYDRVAVAHVGDSRCYLIRRHVVRPLTRDHTVANEQIRLGLLSESDLPEAETRHVLLRSLGSDLVPAVDVSDHQVYPGDVLLLCSDGLHGALSPADIAREIGEGLDPKRAVRALVALANERDGSDNISAQLLRVHNVERVGMYRGRPYKLR